MQVVLLLISGLPLYDSLITAMGSAGTGGFSNMNLSIGAYGNAAAEMITAVFMLLFGVNFSMYYYILNRQFGLVKINEELKLYVTIVLSAIILIAANIMPLYGNSILQSFRYSIFQVASIVTTTGYSTADFHVWPMFSKAILMTLMVIGACAGSTGGGVKVIPVAFLIVKDGNVRILPLSEPASTTADRVVDMVPDVLDRVSDFIDSHTKKE